MTEFTLVFPHQLFKRNPSIRKGREILLAEDALFFGDGRYPAKFHKHKLVLHRSTLKSYEDHLKEEGFKTHYLEYKLIKDPLRGYIDVFKQHKVTKLFVVDPVDFILEKRIQKICTDLDIDLSLLPSPSFYIDDDFIEEFGKKSHYSFTPFYIALRKKFRILITPEQKPEGDRWTFDIENRKKAPKGLVFPSLPLFKKSKFDKEAQSYVDLNFPNHPGKTDNFWYPTTPQDAEKQLDNFLENRLVSFGPYQDAILKTEPVLMHSVLSCSLNIGHLTPQLIVDKALKFDSVPLSSLEGFIRQILGWREFIRLMYKQEGVALRTTNYWKHKRQLPQAFYLGTTGIEPVDDSINKAMTYSYCHHIERLMILGNFMLLCEINPDDIYRWFMEMFIDAYDWVMVPNVYGMSQYSDGGLMTTKPYISGSNYVLKMSDYRKGEWCEIWDSLFWRFLYKHVDFFKNQPRLGLLTKQLEKMGESKLKTHLFVAEKFLKSL